MGGAAEKERKIAIKAMYTQLVRDMDARNAATEAKKIADANMNETQRRYTAAWQSFAIFGFDTTIGQSNDLHAAIKEYLGDYLADEAIRFARGQLDEDEDQNEGDVLEIDEDALEVPIAEGMPTIREIVLAKLNETGDSGTKAAPIRAHVETILGRKLHYKTVGMTLFRLKKDSLARSEGHTWFPVQPEAETVNPGAGTPGPEEGQNGKEEA